ncbi:NAD(P)-binding protein [Blastococcus sp. SYSU D00820]
MPEPQLVVGGSVAALVAADALAAAGRPVRLLLPRRGIGGGFGPVERGGYRLELGMRLLELRYEGVGTPPPLTGYRPEGEGHRPFVGLVDDLVRDLVGADAVVPVATPACFLGGRLVPEVLVSGDLSRAPGLVDAGTARRIAEEAAALAAQHGDAGLLAPDRRPALWDTGLDDASLAQHGRTFHQLFLAPFTGKVRPAGGGDVLAALRRKVWAPLYWPRTVAEAFGGRPPAFVPERPMTVVRPGGTGRIVAALVDRLTGRGVEVVPGDAVTAVAADGDRVRVTTADGRAESARRPVLGLSPKELFAAAGIDYAPRRVESVMAWLGVPESAVAELPGFVHVLDPDVPAYRVTPGDSVEGTRVVCVELAHSVPRAEVVDTARDVVVRLGLVPEGTPLADLGVHAGPSFTDPTADSRDRHAAALAEWAGRELDAVVVGGAQAFGYDSFNEQVLQGLQAAEQLA